MTILVSGILFYVARKVPYFNYLKSKCQASKVITLDLKPWIWPPIWFIFSAPEDLWCSSSSWRSCRHPCSWPPPSLWRRGEGPHPTHLLGTWFRKRLMEQNWDHLHSYTSRDAHYQVHILLIINRKSTRTPRLTQYLPVSPLVYATLC